MSAQSMGRGVCRALTLVTMLLLAGCGGGSGRDGGTHSGGSTPSVTPGGTLRIGLWQEPTTLLGDGITDDMAFAFMVDAPVSEGLLWYRSTEQTLNAKSLADFWQPWLATEVPTIANGDVRTSGCADPGAKMCVTWKLRDDVTWQDGTPFTAHDVCATAQFFWLRYGDHNPTPLVTTTGWNQMTSCREDTPTRATESFGSVYAPYLGLLSGVGTLLPARQLEAALKTDSDLTKVEQTVDLTRQTGNSAAFKGTATLDRLVVGTGPFVLSSYVPTQSITLVRNNHYWNRAHQPSLDRIVFVMKGDVQAQVAAVKAGEIDMGLDFRLAFLKQLQTEAGSGRIAVQTVPAAGAEKIDLNICASPSTHGLCGDRARMSPALADPRVRHALLEAINRQSIVDSVAAGATVVPADSSLYLGAEYLRTPEDPTTAYDPGRARQDLEAAGYRLAPGCHGGRGRADPTGRCLDLNFVTTSGSPARATAQLAVQQDLERVGVFTNLSTVTPGVLFGSFSDGGILTNHTFDLAMFTSSLGAPAEPDSFYAAYHGDCAGSCPKQVQIPSDANGGEGENDTGINDPIVDRAFDDGRLNVDLGVRARAYLSAEVELAAALPEIPLYQQVTVNTYSTRLQGVQRNDTVWLFNTYDYNCIGGDCQA